MKQVDSSQFEYSDSFSEFASALASFKVRYMIPAEFTDQGEQLIFPPDFTGNYWGWD
jgi:hypothetical protein